MTLPALHTLREAQHLTGIGYGTLRTACNAAGLGADVTPHTQAEVKEMLSDAIQSSLREAVADAVDMPEASVSIEEANGSFKIEVFETWSEEIETFHLSELIEKFVADNTNAEGVTYGAAGIAEAARDLIEYLTILAKKLETHNHTTEN